MLVYVKETGTYLACDNDEKKAKRLAVHVECTRFCSENGRPRVSNHSFTILVEGSSYYTYYHKAMGRGGGVQEE